MVKKQETAENALSLLSDQAVGEGTPTSADGLGFGKYAQVLADVAKETPGPFTVGVFGEWGTGKTSLLRMVEERLGEEKNVITVWFNAWRYESEEQPIVPLVATIVREIERNKTFLSTLEDGGKSLVRGLRAVAYGFSASSKIKVPGFAEIEASFVAKDMIDRSESIALDPLLDRSLFFEAFEQLSKAPIPKEARVVVLIDDLDRCFPDKAIRLLENIKLVLAQPGFIFFLGVARKVLEGYLHHRYEKEYGIAEFEGCAYLDKIVQLPFHIPPHRNRMATFWDSVISRLSVADQKSFGDLVPIISLASGDNPRTAVRFVNNLLVDRAIFRATAASSGLGEIPLAYFAVTRSIEQRWPAVFRHLWRSRDLCGVVETWMSDGLPNVETIPDQVQRVVASLLLNDRDLAGLLGAPFGKTWLKQHDLRNASIEFLLEERSEPEAPSPMPDDYDVFLAYSSEDRAHAAIVRDMLLYLGFSVFDMTGVSAGETIGAVLKTSLQSSRTVIALINRGSKGMHNVSVEIGMALGQKKRVIPVLLPGTEPESLPFNLRGLHALKFEDVNPTTLGSLLSPVRDTKEKSSD